MTDQIRPPDVLIGEGKAPDIPVPGAGSKLWRVVREELHAIHPRYLLVQFFVSMLPHNSFNRVRTALYRSAGFKIGRGTVILGKITVAGDRPPHHMLTIGDGCTINAPLYAELNESIIIGNNVGIGHHVVLITANHDASDSATRLGALKCSPIVVGDGAWIGACATVLPGVTIGAGSVVAAGAVVNRSVAPNVLVGGVPAKEIKSLKH
jgi:maltose O-acetyltransferase